MAKGDPSGQYQPEAFADAPSDTSQIVAWVTRELQKVSSAFELGVSRSVEVLNAAPTKPRDGMVAIADGVNWNPGSGAGTYVYRGGSWRLMEAPTIDTTTLVIPGTIVNYGGTSVQTGYLACDGSNVSRITYAALFAAIGTTWGVGNGTTTFGLPDSRRRVSVGSGGTGTATLGNAVGNVGGEENHTLTVAEVPSHAHPGSTGSGSVVLDTIGGGAAAQAIGTLGGAGGASEGVSVSVTVAAQGGGTAHNVIQPSLVVTKMIKT